MNDLTLTRKREYEENDLHDVKRRNRLRTEIRFDFLEK